MYRVLVGVGLLLMLVVPARADEIHAACERGDLNQVKRLLKKHPGLLETRSSKNDNTPIFHAIMKGHAEVVAFLVDSGADVRARNKGGFQPIHYSANALKQNVEIATILLEAGADPNVRSGTLQVTPLHCAAALNRAKLVRLLLSKGARHSKDENDDDTMDYAIRERSHEVVKVLLETGYPVNGRERRSILHNAVGTGDLATVKILVEAGADVNARLDGRWTPRTAAEKWGHPEIASYLASKGGEK
ncbi:MAG: ankyrin repeat domain-containing protein [Armatimonadetes bacterium]|nr:ankyrin repeat domain-containing protein [Armatimonadota bacterium]